VTLLAFCFNLLDFKYMVVLFLVYALFGASLTIISFMTRNFLSDVRIELRDVVKAFLLCIPEIVVLRYILAWTRLLSIFFYRGKKTKWGAIKRYKIAYDVSEAENVSKDRTP
jgi:biofilm PGA synthesis N-glycosyltransferase PgaC